MKPKMIKLGTPVKEIATGMKGQLTHFQLELGGQEFYLFQPKGLNLETQQPLDRIWVVASRIEGGVMIERPNMYEEALGTKAEDISTFKGTIVSVCLHISGCVHAIIQPKGTSGKTGKIIDSCDFDIRRLSGPSLPVWTDEAREKDQKEKPSPGPTSSYTPRMPS